MATEKLLEMRYQVIETSLNGTKSQEVWDSERDGLPPDLNHIVFATNDKLVAETYVRTGLIISITDRKQFVKIDTADYKDAVWYNPESKCYFTSNMPEGINKVLIGVAPYNSHASGILNTALDSFGVDRAPQEFENSIIQLLNR